MTGRLIQVASSNPGKLAEIMLGVKFWEKARRQAFKMPIQLLPDFSSLPPCEETEATFAGNARKKALHYAQVGAQDDAWVLADDSGLAVDALGGAPGVISARYAGPNATAADNNRKLLAALSGVPAARRAARFVCVLALAGRNEIINEFTGTAEGVILEAARGTNGFGYDPLFLDETTNRTYAELTAEEKMMRSHRGKALFALLDWLSSEARP